MTNYSPDEPCAVWDEYDWERFLRGQEFFLSAEALRTPKNTFGLGEDTERKEFTIRKVSEEEAKEAFKYGREAVDICALHRKVDELYYGTRQAFRESIQSYHDNPQSSQLAPELALIIQMDRVRNNLGAVPLVPPMEEIGLAIAYLKRALEAVAVAIELATQFFHSPGTLEVRYFKRLLKRLLCFRASIINHNHMGDLREEWRQRYRA